MLYRPEKYFPKSLQYHSIWADKTGAVTSILFFLFVFNFNSALSSAHGRLNERKFSEVGRSEKSGGGRLNEGGRLSGRLR